MRLGYLWILVGLLMPCSLWAGETNLVLTIDGATYSNVTWGATTPATVKMFHQHGVATMALSKLPAEWQQHFNYDRAQAEAYRAANVPTPEPPVKMLDREETGKSLGRTVGELRYWPNHGIEFIRACYKQLLELQKTGHSDYRAAINQFIEACKRAIECHYEGKKGAPPRAPDRFGGTDLDNNIARKNIDAANAAIAAYHKSIARLREDSKAHWAEGHRLKALADARYQAKLPPPKPKPTPADRYLQEAP